MLAKACIYMPRIHTPCKHHSYTQYQLTRQVKVIKTDNTKNKNYNLL